MSNFCNPLFNVFYTTANCVTVGINSNCAGAQNTWENLKKSEIQKSKFSKASNVQIFRPPKKEIKAQTYKK